MTQIPLEISIFVVFSFLIKVTASDEPQEKSHVRSCRNRVMRVSNAGAVLNNPSEAFIFVAYNYSIRCIEEPESYFLASKSRQETAILICKNFSDVTPSSNAYSGLRFTLLVC